MMRATLATLLAGMGLSMFGGQDLGAHDVYIMNDNHTDYGWNATTEDYDEAMAAEIDYYLDQIPLSSDEPPESQSRFSADCWWYLYNYEQKRSPLLFQKLIGAIRSGHITVPLNPFVLLYGALPTEAAIRAGYYPGRMERKYGIRFRLAQYMENATSPWGLASIWGASGVDFSWKGICGCGTDTPYWDHTTDVFRWRGPDGHAILKKWYEFDAKTSFSYGSYAEARFNLSLEKVDAAIHRTLRRSPEIPITGLFGAGGDDVAYMTDRFVQTAREWRRNRSPEDRVIVSNGIDYFEALQTYADRLPVLQGGWGTDWDLWPARLSRWTTRIRDAFEKLRSIEMLMVLAGFGDGDLQSEANPRIEAALIDFFKYFEHSWAGTSEGLGQELLAKKKQWVESFEEAIAAADDAAMKAVSRIFETGKDERVLVVNPLGFARTDHADLPVTLSRPLTVVDVATGEVVPSQVISVGGTLKLRFLARDVPALGYRQYRLEPGPSRFAAPAAVIDGGRIENDWYRVEIGRAGEITSAIDKRVGREMTDGSLNRGSEGAVSRVLRWLAGNEALAPENVGPVSATLRLEIEGRPHRTVRLTLFRDIDRIEIENVVAGRPGAELSYGFDFALQNPEIHFEEVGAIARPGLVAQGGNFLPGTNAAFMTLNHFVNIGDGHYSITLSNRDAFAMRVGGSTVERFDLPTSRISVLGVGEEPDDGFVARGGAETFANRFALTGHPKGFSAARAMQVSLAHQNPLRAIALPPEQSGPVTQPSASLVAVDANNVVVVALKPSEEPDGGYVLRLWELEGRDTPIEIDVSALMPVEAFETSLIETDRDRVPLDGGKITAAIGANEIKTFHFVRGAQPADDAP